jgi:hypothetical protein
MLSRSLKHGITIEYSVVRVDGDEKLVEEVIVRGVDHRREKPGRQFNSRGAGTGSAL